jgi:hypothetical protein
MKATGQRIVDRYPHLRDGVERQQMLVRNALASAQVEGIHPDESRLRALVQASPTESAKRL